MKTFLLTLNVSGTILVLGFTDENIALLRTLHGGIIDPVMGVNLNLHAFTHAYIDYQYDGPAAELFAELGEYCGGYVELPEHRADLIWALSRNTPLNEDDTDTDTENFSMSILELDRHALTAQGLDQYDADVASYSLPLAAILGEEK